jgi:hypothetical protein
LIALDLIGETPVVSTPLAETHDLRLLEESDAAELHALIEANRGYLAHWMPWAADQTPADTLVSFAVPAAGRSARSRTGRRS